MNIVGRPRAIVLLCFLISSLVVCSAQRQADSRPVPLLLSPAQAESEGRSLVANLLAQRPAQSITNNGVLKIRMSDGKQREVPVQFEIVSTATNWSSLYETTNLAAGLGGMRLTIIHSEGLPNQYLVCESPAGTSSQGGMRSLVGGETLIPFAGSDFSAADLGLDFLHWPGQHLLKKEMRRGQSCNVLESSHPQPAPNGYSRVVSWIDIETGGIVHADAYDVHNQLFKQFDPTEFKKIHGQYQLEAMEIRNRKTDSRTRFEFNLAGE